MYILEIQKKLSQRSCPACVYLQSLQKKFKKNGGIYNYIYMHT